MRRYQNLLGLAIFCAGFSSSLGAATAAKADFRVCNTSNNTIYVAIGYSIGPDRWYSQGWWEIPQRQCSTILAGQLQPGTFFYLHAFTPEGNQVTQPNKTNAWFCIKPRQNFQLTMAGNDCVGQGTARQVFQEVKVTDTTQTINLN